MEESYMSDTDSIVREVQVFYRAYIDGFNREDADAFLGSFDYPHVLLIGGRGMLVTATASDQRRFHQQTMTALHGRGWGRRAVARVQIWPFSDVLAMIVADVTRYKKDESVLEHVRACYLPRRDHGTWKILALMEIKPPFSGPGEGEKSRVAEADTVVGEVE